MRAQAPCTHTRSLLEDGHIYQQLQSSTTGATREGLCGVQLGHKEERKDRDWKACKSLTEAPASGRVKADSTGGGRKWKSVCKGGWGWGQWQVLGDQNVGIKWQEMGLFVRLEQAKSLKRGFSP